MDACRNGNGKTDSKTIIPSIGKFHIFSSCSHGEVSYEEDTFQNGRFMYYVIQACNVSDGEELTFSRLTDQVTQQMRVFGKPPKSSQVPVYDGTQYERIGSPVVGRRKREGVSLVQRPPVKEPILQDTPPLSTHTIAYKPLAGQLPDFSLKDQEEQNLIIDIIQLPGLNGEWWFQEMPWYLPHARLALAYVLSDYGLSGVDNTKNRWRSSKEFLGNDPYAYRDTNTNKAREQIWQYLDSNECKWILDQEGVWKAITDLRKSVSATDNSRELQHKRLKELLDAIKKSRSNRLNVIDLYAFAVLEHQMALVSAPITRKADTERAKQSYETAINAFKEEADNPTAKLFFQLCLADYVRFLAEVEGDLNAYLEFFKQLASSLEKSPNKDTLFQISVFTDNAYNESRFGRLREASAHFHEVEVKIDGSRIAKKPHPLVANYYEQYGWNRVDYWRFARAKWGFATALLIRQSNAWSSSNPFDMMYVTYGLHARGTVYWFEGNNEQARIDFKDALGIIKKIRSDISSGISNDGLVLSKNRLDEREASSLERLADLTLYAGSETNSELRQALSDYECGAAITNKVVTTKIRLVAKRALLLLQKREQAGESKTKFDEARDCLKEVNTDVILSLETPSANTVIPLMFFNAALIAVDLREAVETKNDAKFGEARMRMREFLERFHLFPLDPQGIKRDTMELRMYCTSLLIESDLESERIDLANTDMLYLSQCLYLLSDKDGIQAYLRPHYELQLRVMSLFIENMEMKETERASQQERIRSMAIGIRRMRSVAVLSDADVTDMRTPSDQALSTKGNTTSTAESSAENSHQMSQTILRPTLNPLVDTVTLVAFYFPDDVEQNGMALIVPSSGRDMQCIKLGLSRSDIHKLHDAAQTDRLKSSFQGVWEIIEKEAETITPLPFDSSVSVQQSVVISWSDELCWYKDSRDRITKKMFPFKDFPDNITVQ